MCFSSSITFCKISYWSRYLVLLNYTLFSCAVFELSVLYTSQGTLNSVEKKIKRRGSDMAPTEIGLTVYLRFSCHLVSATRNVVSENHLSTCIGKTSAVANNCASQEEEWREKWKIGQGGYTQEWIRFKYNARYNVKNKKVWKGK